MASHHRTVRKRLVALQVRYPGAGLLGAPAAAAVFLFAVLFLVVLLFGPFDIGLPAWVVGEDAADGDH